MTAFSRVTFRKKIWRLNFVSCCTSFSSFGSNARIAARIEFHVTLISSSICGALPFARVYIFLSLSAYQRFSLFRMRSNGMDTRPRNSTLWSRSSSNTVTSSTEAISFTLLEIKGELIHQDSNWWSQMRGTHNVKILFQFGANVLYSVCVWRRELISSSTQNGSDLPPKSAAASPVAPNTFTVKYPTSRKFCNVLSNRYRSWIFCNSRGSGLYDVKSVIVSDAVVPLIVSIR